MVRVPLEYRPCEYVLTTQIILLEYHPCRYLLNTVSDSVGISSLWIFINLSDSLEYHPCGYVLTTDFVGISSLWICK